MPFRVRTKLLSVIAVGFILTFLSSYLVFNFMYGRYLEGTILERVREAEYGWHTHEKMDTNLLSSTLKVVLGDREFRDVYKAGDREKLFEYGQPLFKELRDKYGITHFYFHSPDGTTFVRLHNKDIYGDKVERFTFKKAQSTGGLSGGIELGRTAFALRVVAPYQDNGELIGYVELGQEIDHFLNLLKGETKNEFAIIARKEFKHYNDTHGHPAGDGILKGVAACLKGNARENDVVARYGGEEFTIILPETGKDAAMMLAERIRQIISEQPFPKKETQPGGNLTMSFGVATFPADASDLNGLVDRADEALYRAKEGGRNRVEVIAGKDETVSSNRRK